MHHELSAPNDYALMNGVKQFVFWFAHLVCIGVIWTGVSWVAAAVCILLYLVRMFGITGGYHRYFCHHSYKTSRWFQFCLAWLGATSAQKGPLWWASHHRHHHQHSDTPEDPHSPVVQGIWWAHVGWIMSAQFLRTKWELIRDLAKFPELHFIDNYHIIPPATLAILCYLLGAYLGHYHPELGTSGMQMLIVGFFVSTVLLYHGTFAINSWAHTFGKRRFNTTDQSKNSLFLALITLGEGWHNNHHRYPGSEPQGFYWWEIDISHYILVVLSWFGLVWDIRKPPQRIYDEVSGVMN
jgi:stearoyl-CoA desaturase (delta-9 desaturase)